MRRARCARQNVEVDTQKIRSKLLTQLENMFDLAQKCANVSDKPKQKELFMRVMAYIAQVMNSLTKTFDEVTITKDLEELESMIREAMAKGKDKAAQTGTATTSGS